MSAAPVTVPVQLVVADAATHLLFVDNSWDGTVTVREGVEGAGSGHDRVGTSELRMEGGPVRGWVMVGTPARVLLTWASLTGAPAQPPAWAFGHHHVRDGAGGEDEVRRVVAGHRERWLPLDAVHLGDGHLDGGRAFTVDEDRFPKLPVLADELRREGVRLVSAVRTDGRPGEATRPDLTDARVRYAGQAAKGFAGVWHRGDASVPGERVDALCLAQAAYEGLRDEVPADGRPLVLSPSGWAGLQRYGGVSLGDGVEGWPGLRASLARVTGLGLCGVPFSGPDVVGDTRDASSELYVRGLQMAAYLPLLRTGGGPWEYGAVVLGHARVALCERRRLLPYFVTLAYLARRTGAPMVRPLWWPAPEEREVRDCEDAFLLGDALLVAPVLERGAVRREVRLPRGRWYDTATGRAYEGPGEGAGGGAARAHTRVRAGGCGGAGARGGRRDRAGGVGARPGPERGRAGGAGRRGRRGGAGGRAVLGDPLGPAGRRTAGDGGRRSGAVPAGTGPRARRDGRSDVAALEEGAHRHGVQGEGEFLGAAQQARALGLVGGSGGGRSAAGRSGSRPNSSRWPSGALMASTRRTSRLSASRPVSSLSSRTTAWRQSSPWSM